MNKRIFSNMLCGEGVELGALNHPMLNVCGRVKYVDYKSTEQLRLNYTELGKQDIGCGENIL